eukprot:1557346-Rhodomonas_salina.1
MRPQARRDNMRHQTRRERDFVYTSDHNSEDENASRGKPHRKPAVASAKRDSAYDVQSLKKHVKDYKDGDIINMIGDGNCVLYSFHYVRKFFEDGYEAYKNGTFSEGSEAKRVCDYECLDSMLAYKNVIIEGLRRQLTDEKCIENTDIYNRNTPEVHVVDRLKECKEDID